MYLTVGSRARIKPHQTSLLPLSVLPGPLWGIWSVEWGCSWSGRVGPLNGVLGWLCWILRGKFWVSPCPFLAFSAQQPISQSPFGSETLIPSQPLAKISEWLQQLLGAAEIKVKGFGSQSQIPCTRALKHGSAAWLAASTWGLWCPAQHVAVSSRVPWDPQHAPIAIAHPHGDSEILLLSP